MRRRARDPGRPAAGRAAARAPPPRAAAGGHPGRSRAPSRSAFGRFARAVGLLLLIAILAAVIAGAVLLLTDAGQNTGVGEFIKQNLHDQIQSIEDFIRAHTQ